jgi:Cu/Ag efflux pump CusA
VAFRSWSLAFFFFLALPVAMLGGVVVALLGGGPTTLGSFLGLVAVFAIATRNGLTLIHHYRGLEKEEGEPTAELVLRGTRERFVPIVMTAVVTALAVAPFAFLGNIAGHEILHPMSLVILGGLVSATLVNLLVVPSLYLAFGADAEPDVIAEEEPPRLIA